MSPGLWIFGAEAQFFSGAEYYDRCDEGVQKGTDLTNTPTPVDFRSVVHRVRTRIDRPERRR